MFDSRRQWQKAGFEVKGKGTWSNIMVAEHPAVKGYLFKRYNNMISLKQQLENYRSRIKGSQKLLEFIGTRRLSRIVVPQKRLHALPPAFARKGTPAYVLIAEKMPLLESAASKRLYRQLDREGLRQLCTVLLAFKGLDSGVRNVPFTDKGQIAFIDTERWDEQRANKVYLRRIRGYLSDEQRKITETFKAR